MYTVKALDAGPVIASEKIEVDDQIKVRHSFSCVDLFFLLMYL